MRGICRLLLPFLALASTATAGIAVREAQGKVDVAAAAAPLADVLDRLARQTGMKVAYEGPAPRQLVTLSLVGRSPAEAVTSILEGQGLNYALVMDVTGTRVEKLLVTGSASGGSARHVSSPPTPPRYNPADAEPEPPEDPVEEIAVPVPDPPAPAAPDKTPQTAPATGNGPPLPPGMVTSPPGVPPPYFQTTPYNPGPLPFPTPAPPQPTPTPTPPPPTPP